MNRKNVAFLLLLSALIIPAVLAQPGAMAATSSAPNNAPLLELIGSTSVDSEPDSMVLRCEGFRCARYHELVYWGFDNRIHFLDAKTLNATTSPLFTSFSSLTKERYLFYDRYFHQIYTLDRDSQGSFPNSWDRLQARIIRGYDYADSIPINEDYNTPTAVDKYYYIDGAALQQPTISGGSVARIFLDNPVNGNIDSVSFHGHAPENAQGTRISYRSPLGCATGNTCSWHANSGNSLAVDGASNVYIADNNDLIDRIVIRKLSGGAIAPIDNVGSLFHCYVDEAGISMAPDEHLLYLPAGCQSFADGAVAQLDTTGHGNHHVIDLLYKDQDFVTVDWSDQKRAFVATADFDGIYDPQRRLYLHLLYDGQLIATLPVMNNFERRSLNAMAFDPYTNKLYLAVKSTIYVVKVNYGGSAGFPPLPEGELIVTPTAVHDLISQDSSAIFHFAVGAVDDNTRVSYKELPPTSAPGINAPLVKSPTGTMLHPIRQFELTAVISDTNTPLTSFNNAYQLKLYYSPQEIAPIIGGNNNVQLYQWSGSSWQQVGSTSGSSSENLLYIYSDLTGRFAIMGPTNPIFLPIVLR